ncbi:MAG TPA: hypothetical protein ENJ00_09980, partial [Phycisphaerales bacterium]|nr:hypothetical protein [Phycisphaerales bacterium]
MEYRCASKAGSRKIRKNRAPPLPSSMPNAHKPIRPESIPNIPLVLIIRDGWGMNPISAEDDTNAVHLAETPVADALMAEYPWTLIKTCGPDVGLTDGTMGNSEVGHQNIGAGRIVDQDAVRITKACRSGALIEIPALVDSIKAAGDSGKAVHLMGICSDAGVHGQLEHLYALLRLYKQLNQSRVYVHLFTDGR